MAAGRALRRRGRRRRHHRPGRRLARARARHVGGAARARQIGRGTSHVAAGMLAPVAEAEFGARRRGARSSSACARPRCGRRSPPSSAERAASRSRLRTGTLLLARDDDEARELERQLELRGSLAAARRAPARRARHASASRRSRRRCGWRSKRREDHSVDPAPVLRALRQRVPARPACDCASTRRVQRARARRRGRARDGGRRAQDGERAAGRRRWCSRPAPGAARSGGARRRARVPVRPVKGQILRLRDPAGPGLLTRVVRLRGRLPACPRGDGRYVLGASVEERGFELAPTAGGVYELLRDAHELVPGVTRARDRGAVGRPAPGQPDNAPLIGRGALGGPDLGDRPPPQRDPARAADRRAGARAAGRRRARRGPRRAARRPAPRGASPARRLRAAEGARPVRRRGAPA